MHARSSAPPDKAGRTRGLSKIAYVPVVFLGLAVGATLGLAVNQRVWAAAVVAKAVGGNIPCPWRQLIEFPESTRRFRDLRENTKRQLRVEQVDSRLGIELIRTPTRAFWIKIAGNDLDGLALLAYILAEQQWISEYSPDYNVRPGDVVVDVGAHIGTFDDDALRRGAAKAVLVEPDPVNIECIRRNFTSEIASGKVTVIPEGAWSKTDMLRFSIGFANSGTGSFVVSEGGAQELQVSVRPLDEMLRSAGIGRVDFIKMDIEGAEREALRGAAGTLSRWKPRLMMDMYHLPDDDAVLPRVIRGANPAYRVACSVCSSSRAAGDQRIIPYATFFY